MKSTYFKIGKYLYTWTCCKIDQKHGFVRTLLIAMILLEWTAPNLKKFSLIPIQKGGAYVFHGVEYNSFYYPKLEKLGFI